MPDTCSFSRDAPPALWQLIQGRVVAVRASASGRGPCLTRCASPCGCGHLLVIMFDVERAREITLQQPLGRANGFPCCQLSWLTKALRRDVVSAQLASAPSAAVARPSHHPPTSVSREKPHCFSAWSAQTVFLRLQLWRHTGCADDTICIKQCRPQAAPSLIRDDSGAWRMKPGTFGYVWGAHG